MSTLPTRSNSTNPRPGSSSFPRTPRGGNIAPPIPRRSTAAGGHARTASGAFTSGHQRAASTGYSPRPRPTPRSPPGSVDGATKTQVNQTYAIAMMASPYNPLPFPLPIPLSLAMLLGPSGNSKGNAPAPRR